MILRLPRRLLLLTAITAVAALLLAALRPSAASAHPLGNFTVNHYDRITVSETGIEVFSVLDMAEIPALQTRQRIDVDGDGEVSAGEASAYAEQRSEELQGNLRLTVGGEAAELREVSRELTFPAGEAGLVLLRLEVTHAASLPADWYDEPPAVAFENLDQEGRDGWREIIVVAGAEVAVEGNVAREDMTRALTSYPNTGLSSPLDVRSAAFEAQPAPGFVPPPAVQADDEERATRGNPDGALARYASLIAKDDLGFGVVAVALLAAVGFGALHALSPGHGKTIVAAYLVGSRGTMRHALLLGLTVTATHTSSVYAMGLITLSLSEYVVPADIYPWLSVTSGALILVLGLALLVGRLRSSGLTHDALRWLATRVGATDGAAQPELALATATAGHAYEGHAYDESVAQDHRRDEGHAHGAARHSHGFGAAHNHAIPGQDAGPVTWQRLVGLGMYGGMIPCPSAIVVMLGAASLHRVGFGLVLILAFSAGLAAVLTGIGFALVFAGKYSERVPLLRRLIDGGAGDGGKLELMARAIPVITAAAVVVAGMVVTWRATGQF